MRRRGAARVRTTLRDVDGRAVVIGYERGWVGGFTRQTVAGALPNGTRVEKVANEAGDAHKIGDRATVLGAIHAPDQPQLLYYVEWDDGPRIACAVVAFKIAPLAGQGG